MLLFKVSFNSLIKILSWISSLKLPELVVRVEKSPGQTTILQKSMWSCNAEVWELYRLIYFGFGQTNDIEFMNVIVGFEKIYFELNWMQ